MRKITLITLFFALSAAGMSHGQVAISNVDQILRPGAVVTVSGSGFGTKTNPQPIIFDDLNWAAYQGLNDGDVMPTQSGKYGHPQNSSAPWNNMDSSYPESSIVFESRDSNVRIPGRPVYSIVGGRGSINGVNHLNSNYLLLDYWFYSESANAFPLGSDGEPDGFIQTKLMRFWPDPNKKYGHDSMYPGRVSYDPGPTSEEKNRVYRSLYPQDGQWTHITVWIDGSQGMSEGGSNGIMKAWSNNQLIFDINDMGWLTGGASGGAKAYTYLALFGIDPVDRSGHIGKKNFMGDIYLDTTLSRVILADASTWQNVSHYEMQVPVSWNGTAIDFEANVGSFSDPNNLWLYVSDAQGNVNPAGYKVDAELIVVGGGPGQPTQPVLDVLN